MFLINDNPPVLPKLVRVDTPGEKRVYNTPLGPLPSVTSVLGHFKDKKIEEWYEAVGYEEAARYTRTQGRIGSAWHNLAEQYLWNVAINEQLLDPVSLSMFRATRSTIDAVVKETWFTEVGMYSSKLRVAGTSDCVALTHANRPAIVDFKATGKMKQKNQIGKFFEQESAYAEMFEEHTGIPIDLLVIIMTDTNTYDVKVYVDYKKNHIGSMMEKCDAYHKEFS